MDETGPTLHMLCGKIAAGKSTLAAELARGAGTVLIAEDDWLGALFGAEMKSPRDFMRCSGKLRAIMGPHVVSLLENGVSVVLDFQANTVESRAWMRGLIATSGAAHRLHLLDVPDRVCLDRLAERNARGDHAFQVTEEQFRQVTGYFVPPGPDEGFDIVVHRVTG